MFVFLKQKIFFFSAFNFNNKNVKIDDDEFISRDEQPIDESLFNNNSFLKTYKKFVFFFLFKKIIFFRCKYTKMDLILILDASTSRANVFEQQRELALSLIERLNVSENNNNVAVGISSFTDIATIRQELGIGQSREVQFFFKKNIYVIY